MKQEGHSIFKTHVGCQKQNLRNQEYGNRNEKQHRKDRK